jgi:hypothetical protein
MLALKIAGALIALVGLGAAAHYSGHGHSARAWVEGQFGIKTIRLPEAAARNTDDGGQAALTDLYALRAVTDQWTALNDAIGVINAATAKSVSQKTGDSMVATGVPPLLKRAVRQEPVFERRLNAVAVTTPFGKALKDLDFRLLRDQTSIANKALRAFRLHPENPWTAVLVFGNGMNADRTMLNSEAAKLAAKLPASARVKIEKILAGGK